MADVSKYGGILVANIAKILGVNMAVAGPTGASINSLQYLTVANGANAISSVDTTKTIVLSQWIMPSAGPASYSARLTSSTNVQAVLVGTVVRAFVIEFTGGINSLQRNNIVISTGGSGTKSISSVDLTKSIIIHNGCAGTQSAINRNQMWYSFNSSTQLYAQIGPGGTNNLTGYYEILEFE
ncbi:MAG: hypothetical protein V3W20_07120 [Candidatus Neomarinimicrobiota bacterium]